MTPIMSKFSCGRTKTTLLASVALFAVSSATVEAADKIQLKLGGYLETAFIAAEYDTGDQLPTDIRHEGEVHFSGSTVLDNGLEFGVNIQLEARQSTDQVDETYMYVQGSFGRINVGSEDSSAYLMHYYAPDPVPAISLNDPHMKASGFTTPNSFPNEIGDADKITYLTPRLAGFQAGASFTPDADEETSTGAASPYEGIAARGDEDEAFSLAANYKRNAGNMSLAASIGWQVVTRDTAGLEDTDEIAAGLKVGYGGFTVGGAYKYSANDSGTNDLDRHDWNLGVTYGRGPWSFGVQYAGIALDDAGNGEQHAIVIGGKFLLGAGITAFGGVQYWNGEDDLIGTNGEDATVLFVGTAISF